MQKIDVKIRINFQSLLTSTLVQPKNLLWKKTWKWDFGQICWSGCYAAPTIKVAFFDHSDRSNERVVRKQPLNAEEQLKLNIIYTPKPPTNLCCSLHSKRI